MFSGGTTNRVAGKLVITNKNQRLILGLLLLAGALAIALYTDSEIFFSLGSSSSIQTITAIYLTVLAVGVVLSLTMSGFTLPGVLAIFLCQGLAEFKALRLLAAAASRESVLKLRVEDLLGFGFVAICIALAVVISRDSNTVYRGNLILLIALLPLVLQHLGWPTFSF